MLVTEAYGRRCAISREAALPALEAGFIRPPSSGGLLRVDNGILLRADLRRLFEGGYLTVTPEDYRVRVSRRLAEDYGKHHAYLELDGGTLTLPDPPEERPRSEFLAWHVKNRFRD